MTVSRHPVTFGAVALAAAILCSSCGSSSPSVATLRQQVLSITTSTNKALGKDRSAKTPSEVDAKYGQAFAAAARQFKAIQFPASDEHDAKALISELDTMAVLAQKVSVAAAKNQQVEANVLHMAQINLKLIEAEKSEKADSNALRHELGLPPEATTTTTTTTAPAVLNSPKG
jgi:cytochrome c556